MDEEFENHLNRLITEQQEMQRFLKSALAVNRMQKQRLLDLEDRLIASAIELRSLKKQMSRKAFSLRNLFKRN